MNVRLLPRFSQPALPSPKYLLDAGRAGLWEEGLGALVFSHLSEAQRLPIPPQQPEVPTLPHGGTNELPASPLLCSFHLRWPRNAGWGQLSSLPVVWGTRQISQSPKLAVSSLFLSWPPGPRPQLERSLSLTPWTSSGHALSLFLSPHLCLYRVPVAISLCLCLCQSLSLCFSNSVVFLLGVLKTQTSDVAAPRARDLREASAADWPLSSEPQKSHKATETPHRLKGTEHRPHFLSGGLSKNLWACFKTTRLGTSLAVRWLRLCLPAQRVGVRSLVGESKIPRTS